MTDEVLKWIKQEKLISAGDIVIAGVSGGADSVCLLLLLLEYQKKIRFDLRVLHVEHGIRGEESLRDARFVEELCRKKNVPCRVCYVDVPAYAAEMGLGFEEAARELRYDCYAKYARQIQAQNGDRVCENSDFPTAEDRVKRDLQPVKIALAHHADDNAETILFQLVRGSGVKGLCGMRASRSMGEQIQIIRPLLMVSRREIEEYLTKLQQEYHTDSTNLDVDYTRNRIRHRIMPELTGINSQALLHISQSAGMLQEISDYLAAQAAEILAQTVERERDRAGKPAVKLSETLFLEYPNVVVREAVLQILGEVAGSRKDIGSVHVTSILELSQLQVGRRLDFPYGMEAERVYGGIRIYHRESAPQEERTEYEISGKELARLERGETISVPLSDGVMCLRILENREKVPEIPKKTYTKWLDYDKIKNGLQLRRRMAGDYLVIDEKGHRKKLKEYFIEEKIPGSRRSEIWLLAEESYILWVIGGRISADCKIEETTGRILEVQMTGGKYYED